MPRRKPVTDYKLPEVTPTMDADLLTMGLNSIFLSKSPATAFAIARKRIRRSVTSESLMQDMLAAIDLLEKHFPQKQ